MRRSSRCSCRRRNVCPFLFIVGFVQMFAIPLVFESDFSLSTNTSETITNLVVVSKLPLKFLSIPTNLSQNVQLIPLNVTSNNSEYECQPTKLLFNEISSIDCVEKRSHHRNFLHNEINDRNEEKLRRLLKFLIENRQVHLIDIGTDTSQDMLYASNLDRFVLIVDHDRSNLLRLRQTSQITKTVDRVVLFHNFIHRDAGQFYEIISNSFDTTQDEKLKLIPIKDPKQMNEKTVVKTIRFDALLPIIVSIGIQQVMIKINLNGYENNILETGASIFNSLTIPLIQMEWSSNDVRRNYVRSLIKLFHRHNYLPMTIQCHRLNSLNFRKWPTSIYWIKTNSSGFC